MMEVEGGWWAPIAPRAGGSCSSPLRGDAVGASRRWVRLGFSEGAGVSAGPRFCRQLGVSSPPALMPE